MHSSGQLRSHNLAASFRTDLSLHLDWPEGAREHRYALERPTKHVRPEAPALSRR